MQKVTAPRGFVNAHTDTLALYWTTSSPSSCSALRRSENRKGLWKHPRAQRHSAQAGQLGRHTVFNFSPGLLSQPAELEWEESQTCDRHPSAKIHTRGKKMEGWERHTHTQTDSARLNYFRFVRQLACILPWPLIRTDADVKLWSASVKRIKFGRWWNITGVNVAGYFIGLKPCSDWIRSSNSIRLQAVNIFEVTSAYKNHRQVHPC